MLYTTVGTILHQHQHHDSQATAKSQRLPSIKQSNNHTLHHTTTYQPINHFNQNASSHRQRQLHRRPPRREVRRDNEADLPPQLSKEDHCYYFISLHTTRGPQHYAKGHHIGCQHTCTIKACDAGGIQTNFESLVCALEHEQDDGAGVLRMLDISKWDGVCVEL